MRSYYCYARTPDNEFHSCNVQLHLLDPITEEELIGKLYEVARKRFAERGVRLVGECRLRFVADPRNLDDSAGYPPLPDARTRWKRVR